MAGFNWDSDGNFHHFSHPHILELNNLVRGGAGAGDQQYCNGCNKSVVNGLMVYTCKPCNFFLHLSCSKIPQQINHPADNHVLNLLPQPWAYEKGICACNACGQEMRYGFSFHCSICQLDLHPSCANLPMKFNHQHHPQHTLALSFSPPYPGKAFKCDVCNECSQNSWHYHCSECFFDVHVTCTQISSLREHLMNQFQEKYRQRMMGLGRQMDTGNPLINQILENHTQRVNQILENYTQWPMGSHMPTTNPPFTGRHGYLGRSYSEPPPRFSPFARPSMFTNSSSFHVHQQPPFPSAYDSMDYNMLARQGMEAIMQNAVGGTSTNSNFMSMIGSGMPGGDGLDILGNMTGMIGSMFGFGFF